MGASESAAVSSPSLGRPRCEVTMTAAPASSAMRMAGTLARMRVSSVISRASFSGAFRSQRMNTRLPLTRPWAQRSEKRSTGMGWIPLKEAVRFENDRCQRPVHGRWQSF